MTANPIQKHKVILDVDTGVDDALAILYALNDPDIELLGITTCFGNVDVDTATDNTLALLYLAGADVPVFRGSAAPLLREWEGPVPWIHGDNGLGGATLPKHDRRPQAGDAMSFIRETVRRYPWEVTLVPVARMTNVAKAFAFDPELPGLVRRVVMMGGAAACPGNVTPVAEANIWGDPEAAQMVFTSGVPITMVGLDVTMQARLTGEHLDTLADDLPYAPLLREAVGFYMNAYQRVQQSQEPWCALHDPLAVAMVSDPSLCCTRRMHVAVETQGRLTTGMTVVDGRPDAPGKVNADVCLELDAKRFLTRFCKRLGMRG
ncbi:MAG: nucleoside hydrolase [Alicyclobacillus herbarius]|uniref:nucleoside hydrolase n=1 Tax=Alicyclobacillus herbarius TaxID=122960 RepID=UPI0023559AA8|nr:nucleoside hydrolase [Alicyclobacillus herbarius]MCL6631008.1 nucleoside hydrolase [Alicyclobacillus herbarius]